MKLVSFTCPACGAQLTVDIDNRKASCEYCGATFSIDDEAQHIRYDNAEQAGYEFEKGRQRAQAEYAETVGQQPYQIPTEGVKEGRPRKRRTWLWILGWILLFPAPLTVLVWRNQKLDRKLRIGIIVVTWIVYLVIALTVERQ